MTTGTESPSDRERKLQTLVTAYIVTGLFFLVLPGTFLGVWNLISITNRKALDQLSPAWLQAHGHAQIFGWIGLFMLGIGCYSLSKMGERAHFAVARGWLCLALWTGGTADALVFHNHGMALATAGARGPGARTDGGPDFLPDGFTPPAIPTFR